VWERIVKKHGLKPYRFEEIAAWKFGEFRQNKIIP
jgi:hypothetical protein